MISKAETKETVTFTQEELADFVEKETKLAFSAGFSFGLKEGRREAFVYGLAIGFAGGCLESMIIVIVKRILL